MRSGCWFYVGVGLLCCAAGVVCAQEGLEVGVEFAEEEDMLFVPGRVLADAVRVSWGFPRVSVAPTNEVLLRREVFARLPSMGFARWRGGGGLRAFTVKDSVGDGAALMLHRNPGGGGVLVSMDVSFESLLKRFEVEGGLNRSQGMSFWMKGDGSSSWLSVRWGRAHVARVRMRNREWHKVVLPWGRFRPNLRILQRPSFLNFSFEGGEHRLNWCVIDRLHVFTGRVEVEEVVPTLGEGFDADVEVGRWLERGEALEDVRGRLASFFPMTVVVYGDRYLVSNYLLVDAAGDYSTHGFSYGGLLEGRLAKRYEYVSSETDFQLYIPRSSQWNQVGAFHPQRARLGVHVLGTSGSTLGQMGAHVESVHRLNPDVVIFQGGQEDVLYGDPASYRADVEEVVLRLKEEGAMVVLCTPCPVGLFDVSEGGTTSPYERSALLAEVIREVGAVYGLPVADVFGLLSGRGVWGLGQVLTSPTFPNAAGHEMVARLLYGLFVDENKLTVWRDLPYM